MSRQRRPPRKRRPQMGELPPAAKGRTWICASCNSHHSDFTRFQGHLAWHCHVTAGQAYGTPT